jgi:hypothetical protein
VSGSASTYFVLIVVVISITSERMNSTRRAADTTRYAACVHHEGERRGRTRWVEARSIEVDREPR